MEAALTNQRKWSEVIFCPHCKAKSRHLFYDALASAPAREIITVGNMRFSVCSGEECKGLVVWANDEILIPETITVQDPHPDMPEDVKAYYYEAAQVMSRSPRSAAVLIRVALQALLPHITTSTGKLMADIDNLVKEGFDADVLNAFDLIRILGTDGAHPDQIMLGQTVQDVNELFFLINYIADTQYNRLRARNRVQALHNSIPDPHKGYIEDQRRGHAPKPKVEDSTDAKDTKA